MDFDKLHMFLNGPNARPLSECTKIQESSEQEKTKKVVQIQSKSPRTDARFIPENENFNPSDRDFCEGIEAELTELKEAYNRLWNHYSIMRAELVEREAKSLYGGFQATACGKDMDYCRTLANARLRATCPSCNGNGLLTQQYPDGSLQDDPCLECNGDGFIELPASITWNTRSIKEENP